MKIRSLVLALFASALLTLDAQAQTSRHAPARSSSRKTETPLGSYERTKLLRGRTASKQDTVGFGSIQRRELLTGNVRFVQTKHHRDRR